MPDDSQRTRLSAEELALLRERYTPTDPPPCPVCGEPRQMTGFGPGSLERWGCEGFMADPEEEGHLIYKPGRSFADEHSDRASLTRHTFHDRLVVRALDDLDAAATTLAAVLGAVRAAHEAAHTNSQGDPLFERCTHGVCRRVRRAAGCEENTHEPA